MACVRNCCCCVNLRVGGVLMGIMTLALSVFSIVPMAISLANRVYLSRVMTHVVSRYNEEKAANNGPSVSFWGAVSKVWSPDAVDLPSETMDEVQMLAEAMLVFFIVAIILLVVYAVCSVLLMYGSFKGRRWLLLPWIICTLAFILAYFVGMCLSLWLVGIRVVSVLMFFIALVEIVIAFYLWVCVISLHQLLGSDQWLAENNMEMRPKFTSKYNSVPTSD